MMFYIKLGFVININYVFFCYQLCNYLNVYMFKYIFQWNEQRKKWAEEKSQLDEENKNLSQKYSDLLTNKKDETDDLDELTLEVNNLFAKDNENEKQIQKS